MTKRCPRCGAGGLCRRWFTMVDRCPRCGLLFNREEGLFLGAFVINFVVTELALLVYIPLAFVVTLPDPPVGTLIAVGVPIVLLVPALFYPFSKTLWAAIDLFMRDPGRAR